jgi:formate C-acetyltransferase
MTLEKLAAEDNAEKREFYKAVIIMYEAVSKYVIRYACLEHHKTSMRL